MLPNGGAVRKRYHKIYFFYSLRTSSSNNFDYSSLRSFHAIRALNPLPTTFFLNPWEEIKLTGKNTSNSCPLPGTRKHNLIILAPPPHQGRVEVGLGALFTPKKIKQDCLWAIIHDAMQYSRCNYAFTFFTHKP